MGSGIRLLYADRLRHRFAFTIFPICVCITGFAILISVHNNRDLQYAALFLVAMGAYTAMPVIVCWVSFQSMILYHIGRC
jgi:hypothetical protein